MPDVIDTAALVAAAERAGFDLGAQKTAYRLLESWRARGLLPHPIRVGKDGKRTIWAYPTRTDQQLLALLRWRQKTRNSLDAVKAALWAEGFDIPLADARTSMLNVLENIEKALVAELAKFTPDGVDPRTLDEHPKTFRMAITAWADEVARMRSRSPIPRDLSASMTLPQRTRAMAYWLSFAAGVTPDPSDAHYLELLFGIRRGRAAPLAGVLPDSPEETFPTWMAQHPRALHEAVATAPDAALHLVQSMLQTTLTLFPLIAPVLISADVQTTKFLDRMFGFLDEASPESIVLLAAVQIANIERKAADDQTLEHFAKLLKPASIWNELKPKLSTDQQKEVKSRAQERKAR